MNPISVLSDARGLPRQFLDSTVSSDQLDVGAYELVAELSMSGADLLQPEGDPGGQAATFVFTVRRAGRTIDSTTVEYAVTPRGDHPVEPSDFIGGALPRGTLTFVANETEKEIVLQVLADSIVEGDETFRLSLVNPSAGGWIVAADRDATITNDDAASVSISSATAIEGWGLVFDVTLDAGVQGGFDLAWQTADGTATTANADYRQAAGVLHFTGNAGETQKAVMRTSHDETVERDETVQILPGTLTKIHPDLAGNVTVFSSGTGTISNDDTTHVVVSQVRRIEGEAATAQLQFTATLSPRPIDTSLQVTVMLLDETATGGEDYAVVAPVLSFAGSADETVTFSIPVYGDDFLESEESLAVHLICASANGRESFVTLVGGSATIIDDDGPHLVVRDVTQPEADSGTSAWTFEVVLVHPLGGPLTVDVATSDGTATGDTATDHHDFIPHAQTLSFAGLAGETQTFTVMTRGDQVVESDEQFHVVLSNVQGGGGAYTLINGIGTIQNDDTATITISVDSDGQCGIGADGGVVACQDEGDGPITFHVTLSDAVDTPLTVTVSSSDETASEEDYLGPQRMLPFSGTSGETVHYVLQVRNDAQIEDGSKSFAVGAANLEAAGRRIQIGPPAVGLVRDDDSPVPVSACGASPGDGGPTYASGGDDGDGWTWTVEIGRAYADYNEPHEGTLDEHDELLFEDGVLYINGVAYVVPGIIPYRSLLTPIGESAIIYVDGVTYSVRVFLHPPPGYSFPDETFYGPTDEDKYWNYDSPWTQADNLAGDGWPSCGAGEEEDENEEEDEEEDPVAPEIETVHADWVVPYTESLTFNPFPTFNYRLAQDVALTVGDGNGGFVPVGGSVTLSYGIITVNPDFTLTYTPAADLPNRSGDNRLKPELDANGNVFRYTGIEHFEAHIVDAGVVANPPSGGGEGELPQLPIAYASVPVELAVSNHLPTLRGDRIHAPDALGRFYLDSPVFVDMDTTVRVDLKQLFSDLDGESDLAKLTIKQVTYNGEKLDMSKPATLTTPEVVDRYPHQIRVPIATTTSGVTVTDPATGNLIVQFGGEETEPAIIAMPAGASAIDFHNTISPGLIATLSNVNFPSQLDFRVTLTDGTKRLVLDASGQPTLDANGHPIFEEVTWDVVVQVRPNPDQTLWRTLTAAPEVDFRPWVLEVTPTIDPLVPDTTLRPSTNWSITTSQPSIYGQNSEEIAGVDVDLNAGEFRRYHPLPLDGSGGTSELAIPGLIYDSSVIHVTQTEAGVGPISMPIIRVQVNGGVPDSVSLKWHNHQSTVDAVPLYNDGHTFAFSPPEIDGQTGVYGWEVTANITSGGESIQLKTAGETPVVVGDQTAIFGAGWALEGVPMMWLDQRDESDVSAARRTYDDRLVLAFPGQLPQIFNATDLTLNNYSYAGVLHSLQPGSTEVNGNGFADPHEIGTLTSRQNPDELVYDDGTGMEYVFKKYIINGQVTYLPDRIEPLGIDFNVTSSTWPTGRRGLSFTWDATMYAHPVLTVVEASDGSRTLFQYDAAGYLASQTLVDNSDNPILDPPVTGLPVRQVFFTVNADGELVEIRHENGSHDRVRVFDYYHGLMTQDQWYDDNPADATKLARHTEFHYSGGQFSEIQLGNGAPAENTIVYQIESAMAVPDSIASVTIDASDLEKYDEASGAAVSNGGVYETSYKFSLDGQLERHVEYFDGLELSRESWDYDHVGFVKRYTDPIGRQTFYWHDYEEPTDYTTTDPTTADSEPLYDPDDYRGNVTYVFTPAGLTIYEYETDDEREDAVGQLVKVIDKHKISATGEPELGGTDAEVVTIFERQNDGRATLRQTIRGVQDPDTGPLTGDPEDYVEKWTYHAGGINQGFVESYTDARGLVTDYLVYDAGRILNTETTDSYDGQSTVTVNSYDALGYLDTVKVADGAAWPAYFSLTDYDYDSTGLLRQVQFKDAAGTALQKAEYEYAADGIVTATIEGNGVRSESTYDKAGLLTQTTTGLIKNGSGPAVSAEYLSLYTGQEQPIAQTTRYSYYADGTLKSVTLPDDILRFDGTTAKATQDHYFDPLARKSWVRSTGVAGDSTVDADPTVRLVNTDFVDEVFRTEADEMGRPLVEENLLTGARSEYHYQDARHDAPTQILETINRGSQTGTNYDDQLDLLTVLAYDHAGSLLSSQTGSMARVGKEYDELGYLKHTYVDAVLRPEFDYLTDPLGNPLTTTETRRQGNGAGGPIDPKLYTTQADYDEHGRLRQLVEPVSDNEATPVETRITNVDYQLYDGGYSRVTTTVDGLSTIRYSDALGRVVVDVNALGGKTIQEYNLAGDLVRSKFEPASGDTLPARQTAYSYDVLHRLRKVEYMDAAAAVQQFDYFDYFADGFWDVVSAVGIPGQPSDYATADQRNELRLKATRVRQDVQGKPIVVQQAYAGSYNDLKSAYQSSGTKDAPLTLYSYSYVPDKQLYAVTTRATVGPVPFDTSTLEVTLDMVPGSSVRGAKVGLGYDETRINRQVFNTAGTVILVADRIEDRAQPIEVQDPSDFLDNQTQTGFTARLRHYLDANGRVQHAFDALNDQTAYAYDDDLGGTGLVDRVVLPNGQLTDPEYDSAGNRVKLTDAEGSEIQWIYDGLGRIVGETLTIDTYDAAGTITGSLPVSRAWDYQGLTTLYTNRNGQVLSTVLDPVNRTRTETVVCPAGLAQSTDAGYTAVCDADDNGTTDAGISLTTTYTLYSDGSVKTAEELWTGGSLDGDGSSVEYAYDDLGRITTTTQGFTFLGQAAPRSRFVTDYQGTLFQPSDALRDIVTGLSLDVTENGVSDFSNVVRTTTTLDPLGRIQGLAQDVFQAGQSDAPADVGQLWSRNQVPGDKSVRIAHNADGTRQKVTRYADLGWTDEKIYTEFQYYGDARLKSLTHRANIGSFTGAVVAGYENKYDSRGLLIERHTIFNSSGFTDSGDPDPAAIHDLAREDLGFRHDGQGQLTGVGPVTSDGTPTGTWTDFTWDDSGNFQPDFETIIGKGGRLIHELNTEYRYDAEGNLVAVVDALGTRTLTWDLRGRLVAVEGRTASGELVFEADLAYDALGRHVATKIDVPGGTPDESLWRGYVRDGSSVAMELDLADGDRIVRSYLNGPAAGEVLAVDQGGATVWTLSDMSGTVRSYATADASDVWQVMHRDFEEFGAQGDTYGNGTLYDIPIIWQGTLWFDGLGYFIDGRWYDEGGHRFLSDGGELRGYRFGDNDPTSRVVAKKTHSGDFAPHVAGSDAADAYGTGLWAAYLRFVGEGYRSILGDEHLTQASGAEVWGLAIASAVGGVAGAYAAAPAAGALGLTGLSQAAFLGAAAGLADYTALTTTAFAFDRFDFDGRTTFSGPTLEGAFSFTIGGAIGGIAGHGIGIGIGAGVSAIGCGITTAIAHAPPAPRQFLYKAIVAGNLALRAPDMAYSPTLRRILQNTLYASTRYPGVGLTDISLRRVLYTQSFAKELMSNGKTVRSFAIQIQMDGFPLDVAPDVVALRLGWYQTLDHRRLVAAGLAGLKDIPARVHSPAEPLSARLSEKYGVNDMRVHRLEEVREAIAILRGVTPSQLPARIRPATWGEAAILRAANQRFMSGGDPTFPVMGSAKVPRIMYGE